MKVIRKIGIYVMVYEPLQKMYRVLSEVEKPDGNMDIQVGFWFDEHTKDEYLTLTDKEFIETCKSDIYHASLC